MVSGPGSLSIPALDRPHFADHRTMAPPSNFPFRFVPTGITLNTKEVHHFLSFSSDGKTLASTKESSGPVYIWDTDKGMNITTIDGAGPSLAFTPNDPLQFCTRIGGRGPLIRYKKDEDTGRWNPILVNYPATSGMSPNTFYAFTREGNLVEFQPKCPATSGMNRVYRRDLEYNITLTYDITKYPIEKPTCMAALPLNSTYFFFVIGQASGSVYCIAQYSYHERRPELEWMILYGGCGTASCTVATCSPDGTYTAVGDSDGMIRVWRYNWSEANHPELELRCSASGPVKGIAFTSDSKYIFAAAISNQVHIWEVKTGQYIQDVGLPTFGDTLAFSGTSNRLAIATSSHIAIYDMKEASKVGETGGNTSTSNNTSSTGSVPSGTTPVDTTSGTSPFEHFHRDEELSSLRIRNTFRVNLLIQSEHFR